MASQQFKITYYDGTSETVSAAHRDWEKDGEWIVFGDDSGLILGIHSGEVMRVERVA
ncbi:MAG: hypothetical protein LC749_22360 [Actinobacteria bacterium]|nr:hypothetical protein [Actinomycetota bacterium]